LTIKSAQHMKNSSQFSVYSSRQKPKRIGFPVDWWPSTVNCPSADSPFFLRPDPIASGAQPPAPTLRTRQRELRIGD
jgi:hypothetical protein